MDTAGPVDILRRLGIANARLLGSPGVIKRDVVHDRLTEAWAANVGLELSNLRHRLVEGTEVQELLVLLLLGRLAEIVAVIEAKQQYTVVTDAAKDVRTCTWSLRLGDLSLVDPRLPRMG